MKTIFLCLAFLLTSNVMQAQFLKKLKERTKKATEQAVLNKSEREIERIAEQALDSLFNTSPKKKSNSHTNRSNVSESDQELANQERLEKYFGNNNDDTPLPESFSFEWKYVLLMESEAHKKKRKKMGEMKITYLLSERSTTFGTQLDGGKKAKNLGQTLMVMDPTNGLNIMLMEVDGKKIIQKMPSTSHLINEENESDNYLDNAKIKRIGTKEIMGYTCQGFEIELEEGKSKIYINPDAPVSFNQNADKKFAPKGFDSKWLKEFENGLMMEMSFISSKNSKHNMKMTCVELVKAPLTVNLSEYISFMDMDKN